MRNLFISAKTNAVFCGAVWKLAIAVGVAAMMGSCAPKPLKLDFHNVPDTEHCQYMKDVCKEAEKFQGRFEVMSKEEREDAQAVLNGYIQQCEGAQKLCVQSSR